MVVQRPAGPGAGRAALRRGERTHRPLRPRPRPLSPTPTNRSTTALPRRRRRRTEHAHANLTGEGSGYGTARGGRYWAVSYLDLGGQAAVSYTHLTLPTNREV